MPVTPDPMTESVEAWTFEQRVPSATTVKLFEWPNAVRVRLRPRILIQIRRQTFTLPYALYALVHYPYLSCDACIAITAVRLLLLICMPGWLVTFHCLLSLYPTSCYRFKFHLLYCA